jgi:prepilin-type N-terminal cleavage/methylation domain-containing protein
MYIRKFSNSRIKHKSSTNHFKDAFSLVELSIVLVILGLLTGGILTGQSLIKAAELRSITTELTNYNVAVNTFKDKYDAIPGDMNNATLFWGKLSAHCNTEAGTALTNGTCNGDGNGFYLSGAAAAGQESERHMFWQHLALAGLIEGTYTGLAGSGANDHSVIGQNIPASKYPQGGWEVESIYTGSTARYSYNYGNTFKFGTTVANGELSAAIVKTEDAWNIDKKIDDGRPGLGRVIARFWDTCTDATSNTDYDSDYLLNVTTTECAFMFRDMF